MPAVELANGYKEWWIKGIKVGYKNPNTKTINVIDGYDGNDLIFKESLKQNYNYEGGMFNQSFAEMETDTSMWG